MKRLKFKIGQWTAKLIRFLARKAKLDLIRLGYSENGITKSYSYTDSGETFFIASFLPTKINTAKPIFFDIGANKGDYTKMLRNSFSDATIYSFEPNPGTFKLLQDQVDGKTQIIQKGMGNENGTFELFFDAEDETSVQATTDPEILKRISGTKELKKEKIEVITLNDFCRTHHIEHIDFLKIDTEGFELEVLQGASELLEKNNIPIIQFEFNEVNVIKRRFLKDFYELLRGYEFYRLDEKRLIPLGEWEPRHEIFMFQNIVAILQ